MTDLHEKYVGLLKEIEMDAEEDIEMAHVRADDALCELLNCLGYDDVTDIFEKIPKWYA